MVKIKKQREGKPCQDLEAKFPKVYLECPYP
jgi:hypothetical protein